MHCPAVRTAAHEESARRESVSRFWRAASETWHPLWKFSLVTSPLPKPLTFGSTVTPSSTHQYDRQTGLDRNTLGVAHGPRGLRLWGSQGCSGLLLLARVVGGLSPTSLDAGRTHTAPQLLKHRLLIHDRTLPTSLGWIVHAGEKFRNFSLRFLLISC
jgi:hypothetical protein